MLNMMNDSFINYVFDYQTFIKSLQRNDNLFSVVCNNCDFDIRAYFGEELKSAIERELITKEQKDEFQKFIESKNEQKKGIEEELKPNLEKQNFKNLNDEFNSK